MSTHCVAGAALGLAFSLAAHSADIFVDDTATGDNDGSEWQHAYTDLQDALNVAQSGDQVLVAAGTYLPSEMTDPPNTRSKTFKMLPGVKIYGHFAGTTKLIPISANSTILHMRRSSPATWKRMMSRTLSIAMTTCTTWSSQPAVHLRH